MPVEGIKIAKLIWKRGKTVNTAGKLRAVGMTILKLQILSKHSNLALFHSQRLEYLPALFRVGLRFTILSISLFYGKITIDWPCSSIDYEQSIDGKCSVCKNAFFLPKC